VTSRSYIVCTFYRSRAQGSCINSPCQAVQHKKAFCSWILKSDLIFKNRWS